MSVLDFPVHFCQGCFLFKDIILKYTLETSCKMFSSSEHIWRTCKMTDSFFPQDECAASLRLNTVKLSQFLVYCFVSLSYHIYGQSLKMS